MDGGKKRPWPVTLACLILFCGILVSVGRLVWREIPHVSSRWAEFDGPQFFGCVALHGLLAAWAVAIWKGKRYAQIIFVLFMMFGCVAAIFVLLGSSQKADAWITLGLDGVLGTLLLLPSARAYFRKNPDATTPTRT